MTKLIIGLSIVLATAASCPKDKEELDAAVRRGEILVDTAYVEGEVESVPDTLSSDYKSSTALGRIQELHKFLEEYLRHDYPGDIYHLYETYRSRREKLLEGVYLETVDLISRYRETYDYRTNTYMLSDALKKEMQPIYDAHIKIEIIEEDYRLDNEPFYYYNMFKDSNLQDELKTFLKLEATRNNTDFENLDSSSFQKEAPKQLLVMENFLVENKENKYGYYEVKKLYTEALLDYLFGNENQPSLVPDEGTLTPEALKNFKSFIAKNPKTGSAKLITIFIEKANNGESGLWDIMEKETNIYFEREP